MILRKNYSRLYNNYTWKYNYSDTRIIFKDYTIIILNNNSSELYNYNSWTELYNYNSWTEFFRIIQFMHFRIIILILE